MSRIGKKPISIPKGVTLAVNGNTVEVKGTGGALKKSFPEEVQFAVQNDQLVVSLSGKGDAARGPALFGLTRTLIANMVQGVVSPWKKELEIQGVGFRATKNGQVLNLQVGYSHPIDFKVPEGVQFSVDPKQTLISLSSPDKDLLGAVTSEIRSLRKPEPYKGKGIRYVGEHILRKAGKAAGAVGGKK